MSAPVLPPAFFARPIAHRALHGPGVPENSRGAISAAIAAGYGIEVDVQFSADQVPLVFHDDGLERLTPATGPVWQRTARELRAIELLGGNEGIPTLSEVLDLVGGRVPLLIELKDQTGNLGPEDHGLEAAVLSQIEGYDGPVALMSFNPSSVARVASGAPSLPRGLVTSAFDPSEYPGVPEERRAALARIASADSLDLSFISHEWDDLASRRVRELAAAGVPVLCWTIRNQAEEDYARRLAENITFESYLPATTA